MGRINKRGGICTNMESSLYTERFYRSLPAVKKMNVLQHSQVVQTVSGSTMLLKYGTELRRVPSS